MKIIKYHIESLQEDTNSKKYPRRSYKLLLNEKEGI